MGMRSFLYTSWGKKFIFQSNPPEFKNCTPMSVSSRLTMTIAAVVLLTPFFLMFGKLCLCKIKDDAEATSKLRMEAERKVQAANAAIAKSGQPAVAGLVSETWICFCRKLGVYATVGAHGNLGLPGLLLALSLLAMTIYCIWNPLRG